MSIIETKAARPVLARSTDHLAVDSSTSAFTVDLSRTGALDCEGKGVRIEPVGLDLYLVASADGTDGTAPATGDTAAARGEKIADGTSRYVYINPGWAVLRCIASASVTRGIHIYRGDLMAIERRFGGAGMRRAGFRGASAAPAPLPSPLDLGATWWAAGEDIEDSGGDLTTWPLRGDTTPGPIIPGDTGDYAGLTGTPQVATVNGSRALDFSANTQTGTANNGAYTTGDIDDSGPTTFTVIFRLTEAPAGSGRAVVYSDEAGAPALGSETNDQNFRLTNGSGRFIAPRVGDWVHFTAWNNNTTLRGYLNGVQVLETTGGNIGTNYDGRLALGFNGVSGTQAGTYNVSDMAFYSEALGDEGLASNFAWAQSVCDALNGNSIRRTIFWGAGQSNMLGFAGADTITDDTYDLDGSDTNIIDAALLNSQYSYAAVTVTPSGTAQQFSIEAPLGILSRAAGEFPVVIRTATNGSDLENNWDPAAGGNLYEDAATFFTQQRAIWPYGSPVAGIVWTQGESDAQVEAEANAYATNLAALITAMRSEVGDSSLPFVVTELSDDTNYDFKATVRAAQVSVVGADANAVLVETDDLTLGDGVHYDGDSLVGADGLGERVAVALGYSTS